VQTNLKVKLPRFNPAVLPMEYMPRVPGVVSGEHARHYLIPGKVFVSPHPYAITTIVGTGVALCLWDPTTGIGGANHFLLPEGLESGSDGTKYGNVANEELLRQVLALGASLGDLQAKLFGGSEPQVTFGSREECLGQRNLRVATHFLGMKGIRVADVQAGGTRGRKLVFQTEDGQAWSQQL
jgi:chemotaxis protein CheD